MKMIKRKREDILTQLGIPKRKLPKGWVQAIGLLKHKPIDGLAYQKQIRQESDGYLERQIRIAKGAE